MTEFLLYSMSTAFAQEAFSLGAYVWGSFALGGFGLWGLYLRAYAGRGGGFAQYIGLQSWGCVLLMQDVASSRMHTLTVWSRL